jgi:hypothetical protein
MYWSFLQYGNITIATNGLNPPQFRDATGSSAFADLAGSPPSTAKFAVMQSNIVLLFNTSNGGNHYTTSDVGQYNVYNSGEAVADGFIIARPGDITAAIAFQDYVIVFKETACFRMRYVGLPVIWTVELISDQHGALGPGSVCSAGDAVVVCDYKNGAYVFDGATFHRVDEGIKAYLVQITFSPVAAQYFRNQESVWFMVPSLTVLQFNLVSQALGKFTAATPVSQSLTNNGHVLVTGSGIYDELRGATMVDVADTYPILSSYAEDENAGSDNTALTGYLTSGYVGKRGRMTNVIRVTPALKTPDSVIGTVGVPTASALTCTPYSAVDPENATTTENTVNCSPSGEKRFDMTLTRGWLKFKVSFNQTPWEMDDILVTQSDAGVS